METKQLIALEAAFETIDQANTFSITLVDRIHDLTIEERKALAEGAILSVFEMSQKILEKHPDGKLRLGEMGDYTLQADEDIVELSRDRQFDADGMADHFSLPVSLDRTHKIDALVALDSQETMQAVHDYLFPPQE